MYHSLLQKWMYVTVDHQSYSAWNCFTAMEGRTGVDGSH